jgi:hypothetical protein
MAVNSMNADPSQHRVLSDRVHAWVRGQAEVGTVVIAKGKGGGVSRK